MDNAIYHNKQKDKPPTTASRKDDIRKWLDEHNIPYDQKDIKKTLLDKVRQHQPKPLYLTDEEAKQQGHQVLRLPIVSSTLLNLHGLVLKDMWPKKNKKFNLKEAERLTPEGFKYTTPDMWRNFCNHVVDVENKYIQQDGIVEDMVDEMRIEDDESEMIVVTRTLWMKTIGK